MSRTLRWESDAAVESALEQQQYNWWAKPEWEIARSINSSLNVLKQYQQARVSNLRSGARLYSNIGPMSGLGVGVGPGVGVGSKGAWPFSRDRLTFNVVQSCIDTLTSKFSKNSPKPMFLTSNGDFKERKRAKNLNRFMDGLFFENEAQDLGMMAFRDGLIFGDGAIHVYVKDKRVQFERVPVYELMIDELEALTSKPRSMHRIRYVDRLQLLDAFPSKKRIIMDASPVTAGGRMGTPTVSDLVLVRESWHLPSGEGAKDGKHVVTLDNGILSEVEEWPHDFFPFSFFRWSPAVYGYWSQGLAEQLRGIQLEIDKLLFVIQRAYHLGGSFKILVPNGSNIVEQKLNNEVGQVIYYTATGGGGAPQYVTPPMIAPEMYAQLQTHIQRAYEQSGISQLSATAKKPDGLDSGKALREFNDIQSDRFHGPGRAYENLFLGLAKISVAMVREASHGRSYTVLVADKRTVLEIDWKDVDPKSEPYIMQCFPVSSLPDTPAGRLAFIQELIAGGMIDSVSEGRRLLGYPDIQQVDSLDEAQEEYLLEMLDRIAEEDIYMPPDETDNLPLAKRLGTQYLKRAQTMKKVEPKTVGLLRDWIDHVVYLQQQQAMQNPPPAPMPGSQPPAQTPMGVPMVH